MKRKFAKAKPTHVAEKEVKLPEKKSKDLPEDDDSGNSSFDDSPSDEFDDGAPALPSTAADEPKSKQPRLGPADESRQPTNDEINELRETESLFHSSLFRLQITELLGEVTLKENKKTQSDEYLRKLKSVLDSLPEGKDRLLTDQTWLKKMKIQVPIEQTPFQVKGHFRFMPPSSVRVVGSYLLGSCVRPDLHADLLVEMPKVCIQAKDHLNQRYLRKRALYLACIASHLHKHELVERLSFTYHHGDHMKPVLLVTPAGSLGKHFTVRLHAGPEDGAFKLNRFHISKSNVRREWFNGTGHTECAEEGSTSEAATPHYNTCILRDMTYTACLECMYKAIDDAPGIRDGVALLKVWLHQRALDVGKGGFSGFIVTMYVAYLRKNRKLNKTMSSYQVMRNTLMQLGTANWTTNGISLAVAKTEDQHRPSMEEFNDAFSVVFVDPTGYVNLCADMNRGLFEQVTHEARTSVEFLQTPGLDGFNVLFMKRLPFDLKFDQLFSVAPITALKKVVDHCGLQERVLDHSGDVAAACLPTLLDLIHKAVGKRLSLLSVAGIASQSWSLNETAPVSTATARLTFGLLLDPDHCNSVLDKGPVANCSEAAEFRAFWGEKSELRRFQDGTICEAVVWPANSLADRRMVTGNIIKHILARHASLPVDESFRLVAGQLDDTLRLPQPIRAETVEFGTGEEHHLDVIHSYDNLCRDVRRLNGLPLTINSMQGTSPVFRFAETFPPMPARFNGTTDVEGNRLTPLPDKPCPPWTPAMEVWCVLEGSGKWPENHDAVQRVKAAFHITLGQSLSNQLKLTNSVYPTHVDVLKDNYVFRLRVGYHHEIALLKMVRSPGGMLKMVTTEAAHRLERDLVALPKLTTALHGIQQQHGSYSGAVRLAKRWLSAHLLLHGYFPEEAVELLTASLFVQPAPFTCPSSPLVGFLRFLDLLATHDWNAMQLVINFNGELKKEDYAEIEIQFSKDRSSLPLVVLATPYDRGGAMWTEHQPTAQILQRAVLLARESGAVLRSQLDRVQGPTVAAVDFKQIFRPPLDVFDVIIHLEHRHLPRRYHAIDLLSKVGIPNHRAHDSDEGPHEMPVTNYDPVQCYLRELRESFADLALFFHDTYGGDFVAVLWKPQSFLPQPFKISHVNCSMPTQGSIGDKTTLVPNVPAIIEEFKILGKGLVKSLDAKTEKWSI